MFWFSLFRRTYKIPPKEHFRLFVRANAMRQRSSSYTPWIVSEDLVRQYNIPSKLASIFINPKANALVGRKRKAEAMNEEKMKKLKTEKPKEIPVKSRTDGDLNSISSQKKPKTKRDPNAPRKKPGPKPGSKRTPKVLLTPDSHSPVKVVSESGEISGSVLSVKKPGTKFDPNVPRKKPGPKPGFKRTPKVISPIEIESSDSDDDISLAVLANKSPKLENGTPGESKSRAVSSPSKSETVPGRILIPIQPKFSTPRGIIPLKPCPKRDVEKEDKLPKPVKKMKQATLFDMKPQKKSENSSPRIILSPKKTPQKRVSFFCCLFCDICVNVKIDKELPLTSSWC